MDKVTSTILPMVEIKKTFVRIPSNIILKQRELEDGAIEKYYEYDEIIMSVEDYIAEINDNNLDNAKNNLALDFRVMEVEFILDDLAPQTMSKNTNMRGMMDMTPYELCKVVIVGGAYTRKDIEYKISVYVKRGRMTQTEADELIALIEARELIYGEQ